MPVKTLLIGASGFVGSNLARQIKFEELATSSNIGLFAGQHVDLAIVAAGDSRKWYANQNPDEDRQHMRRLTGDVCAIHCERVLHFSTVDVYANKRGLESELEGNSSTDAYGGHRLAFEESLKQRFGNVATIRLPGLYGPGLKKNIIFDISEGRALNGFNPDSAFQWFDLLELKRVVDAVQQHRIDVMNVAAEPVRVAELLTYLGLEPDPSGESAPTVQYDIRSAHASVLGGANGYLYDKQQSLAGIGRFLSTLRSARAG